MKISLALPTDFGAISMIIYGICSIWSRQNLSWSKFPAQNLSFTSCN